MNTKLSAIVGSLTGTSMSILIVGDAAYQNDVIDAVQAPEIAFVDTAGTIDEAMEKMAAGRFDCVIFDKRIAEQNSLILCEQCKAKYKQTIAMILMTDQATTKSVVKAFRTGISDYVITDHNGAADLLRAIKRSVERCRETIRLQDENEYLAALATYDRVTGLPNRNFVEDRFAQVLATGKRYGNQFAILLIDINRFKKINDIFGHAVGDKALRAFGRELTRTVRSSDTLGRYGGDEFFVLIDRDVSEHSIELVCERLVSALCFSIEEGSAGVSLSASIGVAFYPTDGKTATTLLVAADHAMYAAKVSGKTGYCFAKALGPADRPVDPTDSEDEDKTVRPYAEADGSTLVFESGKPILVSSGNGAHGPDGFSPIREEHPDAGSGVDRETNRRCERRTRVFKRGRIILNDGFSTIDCLVRDISPGGARVTVDGSLALPERFSFELADSGTVREAIRRWQRGNSIGLKFALEIDE